MAWPQAAGKRPWRPPGTAAPHEAKRSGGHASGCLLTRTAVYLAAHRRSQAVHRLAAHPGRSLPSLRWAGVARGSAGCLLQRGPAEGRRVSGRRGAWATW